MGAWHSRRPLMAGSTGRRGPGRRMLVTGAVGAALAAAVPFAASAPAGAATSGSPLRTLAEAQNRYFGSDVTGEIGRASCRERV